MFMGSVTRSTLRLQQTLARHRVGASPDDWALRAAKARHEVIAALRWASTEALPEAVTEILNQARGTGSVDEVLGLCAACLASVDSERPDVQRICLLATALTGWLNNWRPDGTWTDEQRSRHAELQQKAQLDDVLSRTVQQAAESPFWPERLVQLIDTCEALQQQGEEGLSVVRSVLHCLDQALDQLHELWTETQELSMEARRFEALLRVELRLEAVLLKQVQRSCGAADLRSAALHVGRCREAQMKDSTWNGEQDVLAVLKGRFRKAGLVFSWEPQSFKPLVIGASTKQMPHTSFARQLAEVFRAHAILRLMGLEGAHALSGRLRQLAAEHPKSADLRTLIRALAMLDSFDPAVLRSPSDGLLDLLDFPKLLCQEKSSPSLRELLASVGQYDPLLSEPELAALGKMAVLLLRAGGPGSHELLLLCMRFIDPLDALMPFGEAPSPYAPGGSAIDRAADVAHRLAVQPEALALMRLEVQDVAAPGAQQWAALLAFAQFCLDDRKKWLPLTGQSSDQDVSLFLAEMENAHDRAHQEPFSEYEPWKDFICTLWLSSIVNGGPCPNTALMLLHRVPNDDAAAKAGMVFDRTRYDALLPLLSEASRGQLSDAEQKRLLRRHVIRTAILEPPLFQRVLETPEDGENLTDDQLQDATLSVEEVLLKERERLMAFAKAHGEGIPTQLSTWLRFVYMGIARCWAAIAKARPDWLDSVSATHPWLRQVVTLLEAIGKEAASNDQVMATIQVLTQAAAERNAKG